MRCRTEPSIWAILTYVFMVVWAYCLTVIYIVMFTEELAIEFLSIHIFIIIFMMYILFFPLLERWHKYSRGHRECFRSMIKPINIIGNIGYWCCFLTPVVIVLFGTRFKYIEYMQYFTFPLLVMSWTYLLMPFIMRFIGWTFKR